MRARRSPRRLSLYDCKADRRLARFRAYRIRGHHSGLGLIALPPVATVAHRRVLRPAVAHRQRLAWQRPPSFACWRCVSCALPCLVGHGLLPILTTEPCAQVTSTIV